METTEQHLWELFRAIDRDHNGELDRAELAEALRSNGLTVDADRLEQFFEQLDKNNDGHITFEEWRYNYRNETIYMLSLANSFLQGFFGLYSIV